MESPGSDRRSAWMWTGVIVAIASAGSYNTRGVLLFLDPLVEMCCNNESECNRDILQDLVCPDPLHLQLDWRGKCGVELWSIPKR